MILFIVYLKLFDDLVCTYRFINMFVVPRDLVAWVAIVGNYVFVNAAIFIVTIVHLVVTVAINCIRFVHNQAPRGDNQSTFVLRGELGKRTVHLILTDGSGGRLNNC